MTNLDETNFVNIHLRTRRQKVLFQISFESDCHNIYEPNFTSDEDDDSVNLEDSESEYCTESYDNEDDDDEQSEYQDIIEESEIVRPLEFNRQTEISPILTNEKHV
jgi:hypothetical protein